MEQFIKFLLDNYIYLALIAGFLILGLIGYIVDTTKTEKLKKEFMKEGNASMAIPVAEIKEAQGVNEMPILSEQNVNVQNKDIVSINPNRIQSNIQNNGNSVQN